MSDLQAACEELEQNGYCVLKSILDVADASRLDSEARALMKEGRTGYVNLEGALSQMPALAPICEDPIVLGLARHFFGEPFYLANNVCMKWCQPGAVAGGWHADWPLGDMPQPYPAWPVLLQTMWMLTDFTAANGATCVVPGSHRSGRPPQAEEDMAVQVPVEGKAGSVLVWLGALWHRSGANTTADQHRMGANVAYIPRYIHRPSAGWPLLNRAAFDECTPALQQLLERSVEGVGE